MHERELFTGLVWEHWYIFGLFPAQVGRAHSVWPPGLGAGAQAGFG